MIDIKVIEVENFLSFKDKQRFVFRSSGIHYIHGINADSKSNADAIEGLDVNTEELSDDMFSVGSGKSSFTYICQYVFYGKIVKKVKMDNIVNKESKKDLYTMIEFYIDNDEYRIERYRRHYVHKNNVYLLKKSGNGWVDLSDSDADMTQEKIQRLIILNATTFQKVILFHRDDNKQFLDLNEIGRSEIFENIIQLNRFKEYYDKRKSEYKNITNRLDEIGIEISSYKTKADMSVKYIKQQKNLIETKKEQIRNEIEELEDELKLLTASSENISVIINKINQYKKISKKINSLTSEYNKIKKKLDDWNNDIKHWQNEIESYEDLIESKSDLLKSFDESKCPRCGYIEENVDKKIKNINKQIDDSKVLIKEKQGLIDNLESEINTEKSNIQLIKEEINVFESKIDELDLNEELLEKLLNNDDIFEQISGLNRSIGERGALLNEFELESVLIKQTKDKIKEYKLKYDELVSERDILRKKELINHWWLDKLDIRNADSIKQYIINKIIPVFNNILQRIVDYVYFGELEIIFDNFFNETILKNSQLYSYEELSTGERGKLNLCINLAIFELTRINMHGCSVMFVDEVLVNVDISTVQLFIDLFREKYSKNCAIYFISHQEEVMQKLKPESIIKIIKKNDRSNIYLEEGENDSI